MKARKRSGNGEPQFSPKRRLRKWTASEKDKQHATDLSHKVIYTGNPAHKRNPGDFKLTPPAAPRPDATLCDDAGIFKLRTAVKLLKDGTKKGLVDERTAGEFPYLIWAVADDGTVFEAQLENAIKGEYHGYPMPLADPFRVEVLQANKDKTRR